MKILGFEIGKKAQRIPTYVNEEILYRMLMETMSPFMKLNRDSNLIDTITDGYENSPDVFSIVNRASTMFSQIPYKIMKGKTELEAGPLEAFFESNISDYTFTEFRQIWESMSMVTGNAITFFLVRSGTGDALLQFQLMPSQHVEIIYGGFDNPVKGYKLDMYADEKKIIPPELVWHVRTFPNLDFRDGKNYMGLSPVRVAARLINSQIFSQEFIEAAYKRGMAPGILVNKSQTFDLANVEQQRKQIEEIWERKYGNRKKAGKPIFTVGDVSWIPIGFSNFNDLQIEQINIMALRTLCNVWGIPSRVMNDMEGGAYTKDKEDRKAIYTNRLIPDNKIFWDGINKIFQKTGITYVPDYSDIPELQEDKLETARIYQIGYQSNTVKISEFREVLGLEEDPEMEGLYRNDVETNPMMNNPQLDNDKL